MKYIISKTNEKKYLCVDKLGAYGYTTNKDGALRFEKRNKAENVIKCNLNSNDKDYTIEKLEEKGDNMIEYIEDKSNDKTEDYINIDLPYRLKEMCKLLNTMPNDLYNEKKKLNYQLSKVSVALTDIFHYMEFNPKSSASKRCIIETLTCDLLTKRRELKDNLYYLSLIEQMLNKENVEINEDRNYIPREFNDLFEKDEIPKFNEWWGEIDIDKMARK